MLFSKAFIPTLREDPAEADTISQKLLLRAGFVRKVASGIYEWLPLGFKVLKKVESIIREEVDAAGGQEVWLPLVQPKELWEKSGRWAKYGKELLRIRDRKEAEFCLAPTAEEVITDLASKKIRSWRDVPLLLHQFGTKFRDEIRPRFGLIRGREFYMWDGYSFHADEADLDKFYETMRNAYSKIFERLGLRHRIVEAETGAIGGSYSHEFMVLADTGEDDIVFCPVCSYGANAERAECAPPKDHSAFDSSLTPPAQDVATPGAFSVNDVSRMLNIPEDRFVKTLFYWADNDSPVVCLIRGDHELNESKLKRALGCDELRLMEEEKYEELCGAPVGFAGPQDLSQRLKKANPKALVLADWAVAKISDGVSGANRKDYHAIHLAYKRDFDADAFHDIHRATQEDCCPRCRKATLSFQKGIEVGHIFKLGTKYSQSFSTQYCDDKGASHVCVMGTYGIGVSRIVAASCEQNNDDKGLIWPRAIAPYEVYLVGLDLSDESVRSAADRLYGDLQKSGLGVLFDERDERAGVKFNDADLLGIPLRVTVGKRNLAKTQVELKLRNQKSAKLVALEEAVTAAKLELANYKLGE